MRLHAQTAMIENGFVRIPETAPWLAEYLHDLTVFPNDRHDDQADSTAQFLDWCKSLSQVRASSNYTANGRKKSRSSANRNPSRPYGRSAPWNGKPSRRKRGQPRRLTPSLKPRQISTKTTRWPSSPSGWDRAFESPFLQQGVERTSVREPDECGMAAVAAYGGNFWPGEVEPSGCTVNRYFPGGKEDSCLRDLTNSRAICINYRIRSIYISLHRVRHLAEKPRPRHPGLERRILRLRSRLL